MSHSPTTDMRNFQTGAEQLLAGQPAGHTSAAHGKIVEHCIRQYFVRLGQGRPELSCADFQIWDKVTSR